MGPRKKQIKLLEGPKENVVSRHGVYNFALQVNLFFLPILPPNLITCALPLHVNKERGVLLALCLEETKKNCFGPDYDT